MTALQEKPAYIISKRLTGKVAFVTGGSRGIGAAIARRLAAEGASVVITYAKAADAANNIVKDIEKEGGKALAIQANATDTKAVQAAIESAVAKFGRLDVLVNNAGTGSPKPFEEATQDELDQVYRHQSAWCLRCNASSIETHQRRRSYHHDWPLVWANA